ncbi:MAG: hypothetical protein QXN36_01235 [Candidatus Bathyarchaeia archaeon]
MSQKDTKEKRKERIKEFLREFGALSTTQLTNKINEKYQLHYNKKTIQRDISELMLEGCVKPNPPIGREQTYSLPEKSNTKTVSTYLLTRLWREEEEIEKLNLYNESVRAYMKARLLWLKLPSPFKQKLSPAFKKVSEALASISAESLLFDIRELRKIRYLREIGIPFLIENISLVLHEIEKEGASNE